MTIAARVAAGAQLLDQARPGWAKEIDLGALNVQDNDRCPLGQIFGSFSAGLDVLKLDDESDTANGFFAITASKRRFPKRDIDNEYAQLTAAWKPEIEKRLAA